MCPSCKFYGWLKLNFPVKKELLLTPPMNQTVINNNSLSIVPFAVKFAVPQKAGVRERVPARCAPHAVLMPEAVSDSEQESVSDQPMASCTHCPPIHICNARKSFNW